MRTALLSLALLTALSLAGGAQAQQLDLAHGGAINITASDGIEWHQADQTVIAIGNAHAVRGDVTVVADRLIAFYRKKAAAPGATKVAAQTASPAAPGSASLPGATDEGNNEIYRLQAVGNVSIYTQTDLAVADKAIYDMDQTVLVMTGHAMKITTPTDIITARDAMEYWSDKHMAVARGDAVVTTNDGRQISGDTIVAYMTDPNAPGAGPAKQAAAKPTAGDPLDASGKLQRAEIFGHAIIRTSTQTVRGDRGVYVQDTGMARMAGDTRLTQGQNQVNGQGLEVNLNTGVYRLISLPGQRVQGVVVPNDNGDQTTASGSNSGATKSNKPASGLKGGAKP
jgi:lipopolysaccharide export system protein LptA